MDVFIGLLKINKLHLGVVKVAVESASGWCAERQVADVLERMSIENG